MFSIVVNGGLNTTKEMVLQLWKILKVTISKFESDHGRLCLKYVKIYKCYIENEN